MTLPAETRARVIAVQYPLYLLEWGHKGVPQRGWVEAAQLRDDPDRPGHVLAAAVDEAIPYGVEWDRIISQVELAIDAFEFQRAMREANLWTPEQAIANVPLVKQAFARAYGGALSALLIRLTTEDTPNG